LKSLKIHEVILDRSLNAAVLQHPRLGVLGWHKNYLFLGYQLMLALSPEEMRSVLAAVRGLLLRVGAQQRIHSRRHRSGADLARQGDAHNIIT
jgi:hypothetical protein